MKSKLLLIILISFHYLSYSQYDVLLEQEITENTGQFNTPLNDEDWMGYSVESIGDIDGDGVNDIAVGVIKDDNGGFNRGAVYIILLNVDGTVKSEQKISDNSGGFSGSLDDMDIFGSSLSYLGDMNNDGLVELAVGAEYDGDGGYWHGAIWILSLNTDGTVNSSVKISDTQGGFTGAIGDEDVFGSDIESLGDLNGDGNPDIAVGARRDPDGGSDRGAVWILFLNSNFTVNSYQKISSTQGNFTGNINAADYFGGSIANIGDLNGDGVIDLAVGAYRDDSGGPNHGGIYILFLNQNGTVNSYEKIDETQGGLNEVFIGNDTFFGRSIDFCSDINGDSLKEIIVGAPGYINQAGQKKGAFYIMSLNSNGTVNSYEKITEGLNNFTGPLNNNGGFGFSVSYLGALQTSHSFVVGEYKSSNNGIEKGSAWILQLDEMDVNYPDATTSFDNIEITCKSKVLDVEYTIYNNGTDILPSGTPIAFYADNTFITSSLTQNDISTAGSENKTISLNIPSGLSNDFTLSVIVDDDGNGNGSVDESNEENNSANSQVNLIFPKIQASLETIEVCDNDRDFVEVFDLTINEENAIGDQINVNLSYYETQIDAEMSQYPILDPSNFESDEKQIYIRVESNELPDCYAIGSFQLVLSQIDEIDFNSIDICQNKTSIDLSVIESKINPNMEVASYYSSKEDLIDGVNRIENISTYKEFNDNDKIYLRINSIDSGCYIIGSFGFNAIDCTLKIPEGFSPNNDNINDQFEITGLYENFPEFDLKIFNRYGKIVYRGNSKKLEWNGQGISGKELPTGVYYYILNLNEASYNLFRGWVYLNR